MAVTSFLAMTAAEFCGSSFLPEKIAWMACHFSPYSLGLSNLPRYIPENSLLIVNDITPIRGHDPKIVAEQLLGCVETFSCFGVLLDFQRDCNEEILPVISEILETLPCPVAVTECYAKNLTCPVFLPPLPHHIPLKEWVAPWQGRDIWLETALDGEEILLSEKGISFFPLSGSFPQDGHKDEILHCHYHISLTDNSARFVLWRTKEDIEFLLLEADSLNIRTAVSLYQEFQ